MDGRVLIPVEQFVLKVHSRCDLACDHCYVYESADQSWRGRPTAIPRTVVSHAAMRIAEHVKANELPRVEVVLHGGEPLLVGVAGLRAVIAELEGALSGLCRLDFRVHTNGVLLSEEFCELFAAHDVRVGISLDGDRAANDRHRKYRDGRSSYDAAVRAIRLLSSDRFRHLYSGLLCTIDVANDPVSVYESLLEFEPPRLDLLLPHATWDSPPPRPAGTGTDYADWLIAIFDRWRADQYPVRIRTFDSIIATLAGGDSRTEAFGLAPVRTVVIETDGRYEQADSLKVAFDGAPATGLDVFAHPVDSVLDHPGIAARRHGIGDLSPACRRCPVVRACGGGMYAHRYRSGSGFDNPSVYCADLLKLIGHIGERLPRVAATTATPSHAITDEALSEFAAGLGSANAIGQLTQAQRSLRRGLLAAVYETGLAAPMPAAAKERLRSAWQVLAMADSDRPRALDAVLSHPYLRVWAVRCLDKLSKSGETDEGDDRNLAVDLGHLGAVAAAVAIRGQVRAQMTVPLIRTAVHLPGLGRLTVEPADGETRVTVEVADDWVRVRCGSDNWRLPLPRLLTGEECEAEPCTPAGVHSGTHSGRAAVWEPVRALTAPGIRIALEDTDPYRDCHQWPAAPRLTDQEFARWQQSFSIAWQEIKEHHAAYAPALAAGLSTLMPMMPAPVGSDVSAAARQGFGAIGAALPADPLTLALLLLHEFQHVKLGAILDLYDLFDPADKRLYRAPWRKDLRPLEGLLQGTYAHLAVTAFWRAREGLRERDQAEAAEQYERWRAHTAASIETLAGSGSLTPLGVRFAERMRFSLAAGS